MLQIIAGRSGSGKTEMIHRRISQSVEENEVILLVPEQSTFQNEKRLLDTFGAQKAARVQVLSFKRLYDAVTAVYGGYTQKRIDDGAKAVLMSLAAEAVSDRLVLYSGRSKRSDFAEMMLSAVNEFKMCTISPEQLLSAADKTQNQRLRQKLQESAAVYEAYEALLQKAYSDPDDDLTRLHELLLLHPYFEGKVVYIDAFNGFSGQEKKILSCILEQAKTVCVALCCDKSSAGMVSQSIFREPDTTMRWLMAEAQSIGIDTEPIQWLSEPHRYRYPSLQAVEESIFRFDGDPYYFDDGAVQIYEAEDEYDEVRHAARQIAKLVRDDGYAYRDITVIFRDAALYKNIIQSEFQKFDIPFFLSDPQKLEEKPLIRLILSAFDIIHSSFNTENILSYLKTGLTSLKMDEVYVLENYIYLWDIRGKRWKSPFTMNPDGNVETMNEKELAHLEELRQKVMTPLLRFSERLTAAENGGDMTKAVYYLLQELDTPSRMKYLVKQFEDNNELKQKETEARIWDITMSLLDKMYTVLSDKKPDTRRYDELLRLMIRKHPISDIPQTLDHVMIGVAGHIRMQPQKAVMILGACEGVFPAVPVASGLFSDSERTALLAFSLPLYDALEGFSYKEKFNAYAALSLPSEKLYVSRYLCSTKGEKCEPSVIIKELCAILPEVPVKRYSHLKQEEYFFTERQSFEECASRWKEDSAASATLKNYFRHAPQYADQCEAIERMLQEEPYHIACADKAKRLFGESMFLSASQTEAYYQCPFKYFCRYGLKAYPRQRASMNAGMYGSAVHFILEKLMTHEGAEGLADMEPEEWLRLIDRYIEEYVQEIGGDAERTSRFMAQLEIIKRNLTILLRQMTDEMKAGSFVPSDFELQIGPEGEIPAYELELPTGEKIQIVGKVDRVDTYVKDQCKYIRIIDYKTGNKKFALSDVLYGLNMQMLLYLSILQKNGKERYSEENRYRLAPAGILYMPSTPSAKTGDYHSEKETNDALKEQRSSLRMNGLLIQDAAILQAMETDGKGIFIPVKLKDGKIPDTVKDLASLESYGHIFSYIDKKLMNMAQSLYKGQIERLPVKGKDTDGCAYCDYRTVCGFEEGKKTRPVINRDVPSAIGIIDKEEGNKNG